MVHTLEPTHTCFDDALDDLSKLLGAGVTSEDGLRLVHGILAHPTTEALYAHGWVEYKDHPSGVTQCLFQLLADGQRTHVTTEREKFYREMRVQETTEYTVEEALAENLASGTYGPWKPEYAALCMDSARLDEMIRQWGATTPYKRSEFEARRGDYVRYLRSAQGTHEELDKMVRAMGPRAVEFMESALLKIQQLTGPTKPQIEQVHRRFRLAGGRLVKLP